MLGYDAVKGFIDYVEYYPMEDEKGYDGVHDGGFRGLRSDAPDSAVEAYAKYAAMQKDAEKAGVRL